MIIKIFYYTFVYILCYLLNINNVLIASSNNYNNFSIKYLIKKSCINNSLLEIKYVKLQLIKFTNNTPSKIKITIPEGYTLNNIFLLVDHLTCINRNFFERDMHLYKYNHIFLKNFPLRYNWLEGYLFPDTYNLDVYASPKIFFNNMLNNFNNKIYRKLLKNYSTIDMHNIIIIASIIERESKFSYEQPIISGIINNRIKANIKLEIDATLQYIIEHKNRLLLDSINLPSLYNTYINFGLPEGPISAPGYYAIYAAIFPHKNKFYFYVAKDNGHHHFSKTFRKHNKYIIKSTKRYL